MGRRQEKTAQTKAAIVKSALELFNRKGFDGVSVEEITRTAGVAKGTFYTYFSVKSDIIIEEFWKIDRYYGEYASRNLKRYKGPEEKLRAFTRAQMRYVSEKIGNDTLKILYANQILQKKAEGSRKIILNPERQWYRIIAGLIGEGQELGHFRRDADPEAMARIFNRSMRSIFLEWCIEDGDIDLQDEALSYLNEWLLPALRSGS